MRPGCLFCGDGLFVVEKKGDGVIDVRTRATNVENIDQTVSSILVDFSPCSSVYRKRYFELGVVFSTTTQKKKKKSDQHHLVIHPQGNNDQLLLLAQHLASNRGCRGFAQ